MPRFAAFTLIVLAVAGCLTPQDYTPVAQYTIATDFDNMPETSTVAGALGIRRFSASQPLKRDIFYRDADLRVGNLLDAQWAENPADMMTRYVFDAAIRSGAFEDVGLATDVGPPTYMLTGDLRRFDLDRSSDAWEAVCEIHFELRTVRDSASAWSKTLSASIPLAENEVSALAAAMSEAAENVVRTAMESVIASIEPSG